VRASSQRPPFAAHWVAIARADTAVERTFCCAPFCSGSASTVRTSWLPTATHWLVSPFCQAVLTSSDAAKTRAAAWDYVGAIALLTKVPAEAAGAAKLVAAQGEADAANKAAQAKVGKVATAPDAAVAAVTKLLKELEAHPNAATIGPQLDAAEAAWRAPAAVPRVRVVRYSPCSAINASTVRTVACPGKTFSVSTR